MPNTIYKINDQDPLYNTRNLTPHSVITYMKKKKTKYIHIYVLDIYTFETSCGTRKRNKKHPQDSNSATYSSSNGGKKQK